MPDKRLAHEVIRRDVTSGSNNVIGIVTRVNAIKSAVDARVLGSQGLTMTNVPVLSTEDITRVSVGDKVAIANFSGTWVALGIVPVARRPNLYSHPVFLDEYLSSTSFDGDSFSTVSTAVKIDLSSEFGVPDGIKAVMVEMLCRDSDTWGNGSYYFSVGPSSDEPVAVRVRSYGGDFWNDAAGISPCDASGDVWYVADASSTNTLEVYLRIWGYYL